MSMSSLPSCLFSTVPVVQPPHLEGDASLATEILPGPPSLESIRQLSKRNEPRKFGLPSYLPVSDPGTTYTSLAGGMAAMALDENGPRRKRARMDKGISNRAQRASARHLTGNSTLGDQALMLEADTALLQPSLDDGDDDDRSTSHSRSTSAPLNGETQTQSASANGARITNGKGKGKEKEIFDKVAQVRVKEEPINLQLSDIPAAPTNEDHCSSCSSVGALVYCDGCPRAFHLWCLDPPMDPSDFPDGEESWFCPGCKADKVPPPKPTHTLLSPLIQQLHNAIPTEFRLPEEIRTFFRDVGTGPGGVYVDNSSVKANRIGRHGFGEERDPFRLKDNKGAPVICFKCGKSALPDEAVVGPSTTRTRRSSSAVLSQSQHGRSMISCDFCPLHWHVDCLEPPLTSLPPINRKWKCPNHASGSAPKLRTPKSAAPPLDIMETYQRNNGNIEVINSEISSRSDEKMSVDEVLINGRRYRVPERIIVLDFWNKIKQQKTSKISQSISAASSPLTSLTSLDDTNDQPSSLTLNDGLSGDDETLRVAELLCQLQSQGASSQIQHSDSDMGMQGRRRDPSTSEWRGGRRLIMNSADSIRLQHRRKEHARPYRVLTSSASSSKSSSKKGSMNMNGIRSPHPKHALVTHATSHENRKPSEATSTATSTRSLRNSRSDRDPWPDTGTGSLVVRSGTNASSEIAGAKPSTSSLKIRIPSRLLQKQTSTSSVSASDPVQPRPSISSLQSRPRRSLRRQASMNGTGSERSMSVDHGHDGS